METTHCPGCGAPYDGKKCRMCLYTSMETNLSRRKNAPAAKKQKRQKSPLLSLGGLLVILVLIAALMPGLQNWGMTLDAIDAANRTPEPIPGNPRMLFRENPITVLVPESEPYKAALWFYNHGSEDAIVVCRIVTVNGRNIADAALSVFVPANSAVKSTLLEQDTIINDIAFTMEAETARGEFLFETAPIQLKTE